MTSEEMLRDTKRKLGLGNLILACNLIGIVTKFSSRLRGVISNWVEQERIGRGAHPLEKRIVFRYLSPEQRVLVDQRIEEARKFRNHGQEGGNQNV